MPRPTRTPLTPRVKVNTTPKPVSVQPAQEYYYAGGNDSAVRAARALQQAFHSGTDLAISLYKKHNQEGADRAAADTVAGRDRNQSDKNAGYMNAWDAIEAEHDLNVAQTELPEALRQDDWENKSEEEVRQLIDKYFNSNFKGASGAYAAHLAPGLLSLQEQLLKKHRDMQLDSVRQEQRSTIYSNLQARFKATGKVDYAYAMDQTNTFFDGSDKKVAFWEMIGDMAIENGDPSILDNVPEKFPNGDPTGAQDPKMQEQLRTWRNQALATATHNAKAAENVDKEQHRQLLLAAALKAVDGQDYSGEEAALLSNNQTTGSDITSLASSHRSALEENDNRSWNPDTVAKAWKGVYDGSISISDILTLQSNGVLGTGPQSAKLAKSMMNVANSISSASTRDDSKEFTSWRSQLDRDYKTQLDGPLGKINPTMLTINTEANQTYMHMVLDEGFSPRDAYEKVRSQFDPAVDRLKPGLAENRGSQASKASALGISYSSQEINSFLKGDMSKEEFVGPRTMPEVLKQLENSGADQDTLEEIAAKFNQ